MKYLGSYLDSSTSNPKHIFERVKLASIVKLKLKIKNYTSEINPFTTAQLFKTYIRPVLTYGLENISLQTNEKNYLSTYECNHLKKALKLPTRLHSTDLLNALGIDSLENRIKIIQSSAFSRLLDNDYTFEVERLVYRSRLVKCVI